MLRIADANGITLGKTTTIDGTLVVDDGAAEPVSQSITLAANTSDDPAVPGVLFGSGTIDGDLIVDGGTINPSSTLTITGNAQINSVPTTSDELEVILNQAANSGPATTVTVPVADADAAEDFLSLLADTTIAEEQDVAVTLQLGTTDDTVAIQSAIPDGVSLVVEGGDGDDTFIVDPTILGSGTLTVAGGVAGDDSLVVGTTAGEGVEITFDDNQGGVADFSGTIQIGEVGENGAIIFTGLEPIDVGAVPSQTFTLPAGGNPDAVLESTGTINQFRLVGSTFEDTTFTLDPGGSLTINGGSGNDILTINAIDLPGDLTIDGEIESVVLAGGLVADGDINIAADITTPPSVGVVVSSVDGNISLVDVTSDNDVVLTANGNVTTEAIFVPSDDPVTVIAGDSTTVGGAINNTTAGAISIASVDNDNDLNLFAATGITINAAEVDTATAVNRLSGDINITGGPSTLDLGVINNQGSGLIVITNGGTLNANAAIDSAGGNVSLTTTGLPASGAILTIAATSSIASSGGNVSLSATGSVNVNTSVVSGAGTISVTADSDQNGSGDFVLTGNTATLDSDNANDLAGQAAISISADDVNIGSLISSESGRTVIANSRAGQAITLGSLAGTGLVLASTELNAIQAATLEIGRDDGGAIDIAGAIAPSGTERLILRTGATIADSGSDGITETNLEIIAGGAVTLDGSNNVDFLTANLTGPGDFTFNDTDGLTVPSGTGTDAPLDATAGISTNDGSIDVTVAEGDLDVLADISSGGDSDIALTNNSTTGVVTIVAAVTADEGDITLTQDILAIDINDGTVVAAGDDVNILTANGTEISLGAEETGELSLTDTELDQITASILRIGDAADGDINLRGTVTLADDRCQRSR